MGRGEGRGRGGKGGGTTSQEIICRSHDVTDHPEPWYKAKETPFRSWEEFRIDVTQLVRSTGTTCSVINLQGHKNSPQKSRPAQIGHKSTWV